MTIDHIKVGLTVTPRTVVSAPNRMDAKGKFNEKQMFIHGTSLKVLGFKRGSCNRSVRVQYADQLPFYVYFSELVQAAWTPISDI